MTPFRVSTADPEYADLLAWPFASEPFYVDQIRRLLRIDIPHRMAGPLTECLLWVFKDDTGVAVGFGTL